MRRPTSTVDGAELVFEAAHWGDIEEYHIFDHGRQVYHVSHNGRQTSKAWTIQDKTEFLTDLLIRGYWLR